jgi:VWFA-related protein
MIRQQSVRRGALVLVSILALVTVASAKRRQNQETSSGRDVTILVTAHAHNAESRALAERLRPDDFSVREDGSPQKILAVKRPGETPPIIAILLQDDLVSRVNNEIRGIKDFIRHLPDGSRVMTAYIAAGSLRVAQDFTTDRERAAQSLRILVSSSSASAFSPYEQVLDALRRFDAQPRGRRVVLLVSDGLDVSRGLRSASPGLSMDLDRAIDEAQRRGIGVFTFYAPTVGLTSRSHMAVNFGQGCLNRIADETGGDAFFSGTDFVSFDPYFKELNSSFRHQWLITYRSANLEPGFRKIEVNTDFDLELLHPSGYRLRKKDIVSP